ncbi:uncharacterized protein BP5553_00761 [Venustampulla echinocandica]|uniref:Uncharacterized protein n=1 Tax=Venustampulla echinocandica TaxID=2656787 RepID=A0A370TZ28_9HELO|nr:uncharacterized protein BP5553_00761 [Venustampulla echinocandica]RDL40782.1 hypothetical protein BP5553_00761 [Venustampulla echinocandica]
MPGGSTHFPDLLPNPSNIHRAPETRRRSSNLTNSTDMTTESSAWETYQGSLASRYPPQSQPHVESGPFDLEQHGHQGEPLMMRSSYIREEGFDSQSAQVVHGGAKDKIGSSGSLALGNGQYLVQGRQSAYAAHHSRPPHPPSLNIVPKRGKIEDPNHSQPSDAVCKSFQWGMESHASLTRQQKIEELFPTCTMALANAGVVKWGQWDASEKQKGKATMSVGCKGDLEWQLCPNSTSAAVLPLESVNEEYGAATGDDRSARIVGVMEGYGQLVERIHRRTDKKYRDDDRLEPSSNRRPGYPDGAKAMILRPGELEQRNDHSGYDSDHTEKGGVLVNKQACRSSTPEKESSSSCSPSPTTAAPKYFFRPMSPTPSTSLLLPNAHQAKFTEPGEDDLERPGQIEHSEESGGVSLLYLPFSNTPYSSEQMLSMQRAQHNTSTLRKTRKSAWADDLYTSNARGADGPCGANTEEATRMEGNMKRERSTRSVPWNKAQVWSNGNEEWA